MNAATNALTVRQLHSVLKYTFGIVPIVAGADKFLNLLAQWDVYIHPAMTDILPVSAGVFMMIVGVVEIIAGILVLTRTGIGAYIVSAWLVLIALSLIFSGHYIDVAVRDIVMAKRLNPKATWLKSQVGFVAVFLGPGIVYPILHQARFVYAQPGKWPVQVQRPSEFTGPGPVSTIISLPS